MKKTILFIGALLISTCGFATMESSQLKALGSAWKSKQSIHPKKEEDITIVYGGADISRRPTLVPHTTTA